MPDFPADNDIRKQIPSTAESAGQRSLTTERYELAMHAVANTMITVGAETPPRVYHLSDECAQYFGYASAAEYRKLYARDYRLCIHPQDRDGYDSGEGHRCGGDVRNLFRMLRGDGSYSWIATRGKTSEARNGRMVLISYCIDISEEMDKLIYERDAALAKLQEANRRLKQGMDSAQRVAEQRFRESEQMRLKAEQDPLSGLYNRAALQERVDGYLGERSGAESFALLVLDLDNFKNVNDTLGHLAGDTLITTVASILRRVFRSSDIIARIGGDEFVVFMPGVSDREVISCKFADMQHLLCLAAQERDAGAFTVSMGVAVGRDSVRDYTQLFRLADTALYCAKNEGKNRLRFFDEIPPEQLSVLELMTIRDGERRRREEQERR